MSSVRNANDTFVDEVAEPKLEIENGVVDAALLSATSSLVWGEVVPMPTLVPLKMKVDPEVIRVPSK